MKITEHPVTALRQIIKLSLPTAAVILRRNTPETAAAVVLALVYIVIAYLKRTVKITEREVILSRGVIFIRRKVIKKQNLTAVGKVSFLGVVKTNLILGGKLKETVFVTNSGYEKIKTLICSDEVGAVKKSSFSSVLKTSFFLANTLGGVLTAAAFFTGLYKALGAVFYKSLASILFEIGKTLRLFEQPFYIIISLLAAFSQVVSIVSNCVKYLNFTEKEGRTERKISFGAILKYEFVLKKSASLCECRAHTLFSFLFGERFYMKIYEGMGKKENFYPLTVYSVKKETDAEKIKPRKRSYLRKPIVFLGAVLLFSPVLPEFLLLILLFLSLRYLLNSVAAAVYSSVSVREDGVFLKTGEKAVFYEVFLPAESIAAVREKSLSFLPNGSVTLTFVLKENDGSTFKIKYLSRCGAKEILGKIKNYVAKSH